MVTKVRPFSNRADGKGYSGGQNQTVRRLALVEGDKRVDVLFLEYVNATAGSIHWEFRSRFIRLTQDLLKGDVNWFLKQDGNPIITDMRMAFLLDTVRFIHTGKRRVSIYSWNSMLEMDNGATVDVLKRQDMREHFKDLDATTHESMTNDTFIQKWLTHKGGFDDMAFTINYLFGTKAVNNQ